jgi:hypothetical protein
LDGGEEQSDEESDDRDNDQKLDECKRPGLAMDGKRIRNTGDHALLLRHNHNEIVAIAILA